MNNELQLSIAARLKALRKEAKLSQEKLAEQLGLSRTYIANLESARHSPSLDVLGKLAGALGVTTSHLLGEDTSPDMLRLSAKDVEKATKSGGTMIAFIRIGPNGSTIDRLLSPEEMRDVIGDVITRLEKNPAPKRGT